MQTATRLVGTNSEVRPARLGLGYLDGFRGVLMILVVFGHAGVYVGETGALAEAFPALGALFPAAEIRVPMFFTLSGYALMIAAADDPRYRLRGGFVGHVRRRARRLIPPYLVAVGLCVMLVLLVPTMNTPAGTPWDPRIPLTVESVVTHVLLVHNLWPDLFFTMNGTLWTMAVEWQLGVLMPLLLVFWRRVPPSLVVVALFGVWLASSLSGVLSWSAPVLLGVFGIGMYAACMVHGSPQLLSVRRPALIRFALGRPTLTLVTASGLVFVALVLGVVGVEQIRGVPVIALRWILAAGATGLFLIVMGHREREAPETRLTRLIRGALSWRPLRWLGLVSYSVYLVHSPLLALFNLTLLPFGLPPLVVLALQVCVAVPIVVVVGAVFARFVERPFMNSHQRTLLADLGPGRLRRGRHAA